MPHEALSYPLDGVPAPGEVHAVADGIYWLRMPLPFALDHINLWLLRDGDGWTIVDTGYALDEVRGHWRTILAGVVGEAPVHRVIVTHFHPDHVGLADWLCEQLEAPLWMTAGEFFMAQWVFNDGGIGDFFSLFHESISPSDQSLQAELQQRDWRSSLPWLLLLFRCLCSRRPFPARRSATLTGARPRPCLPFHSLLR